MAAVEITSVQQLVETFEPTFRLALNSDGDSAASMTFHTVTDDASEDAPEDLNAQYTEDVNGAVLLDTVAEALQVILPTAGIIDPGTGVWMLTRHNPMKFPYVGQRAGVALDTTPLYAHSVDVMPYGTASSTRVSYNATFRPESPRYSRTQGYTFEVDFRPIDYVLLEDDAVETFTIGTYENARAEWMRNCRIRWTPFLDVLTLEGGQLQFAEDSEAPYEPHTYLGQAFPAPIMLNEAKGTLTITWLNVPADYVLGAYGGVNEYRPLQFERCLGKVNSHEFLGWGVDRLLFREPAEFVAKPYGPLKANVVENYAYPWQYDISIKLITFDPPSGNSDPIAWGHNTFAPKGQTFYLTATRPKPSELLSDPADPGIPTNPLTYSREDLRWLFQYSEAN